MPDRPESDGATIGPARAGAAGVLGGAAAVGLVWVLAGRAPLPPAPPPMATPAAEPIPAIDDVRRSPPPTSPDGHSDGRLDLAPESDTESADEAPQLRDAPAKPATLALRVDLNRANADELELLPGIGPVLAQRIVDERARNGRFTSLLDFQRVPGIGEKKAAALAPHIRFD